MACQAGLMGAAIGVCISGLTLIGTRVLRRSAGQLSHARRVAREPVMATRLPPAGAASAVAAGDGRKGRAVLALYCAVVVPRPAGAPLISRRASTRVTAVEVSCLFALSAS